VAHGGWGVEKVSMGNETTIVSRSYDSSEVVFEEASVVGGYQGGFIPPSTLYLDVTINAENPVTGSSMAPGFRLTPTLRDNGLLFKKGNFGISLAPLSKSPLSLGVSNIYYIPGEGMIFGWFSTSSIPDPRYIAVAGAIVFLQTILSCEENCGLEFVSNLTNSAVPVNILREGLQLTGVDTSENACARIEDQNELAGCLAYSASYRKQGLEGVAYDMLADGLNDKTIDPFVRAVLMSEMDIVLSERRKGGIFIGAGKKLERNVISAVDDVDGFIGKYGEWLKGDSKERPTDEGLRAFLGRALYLLRKLNMAVEITGDRVKIKGSAPLDFDRAEDIVRFVEVTSSVYNIISESDSVWQYLAGEINSYSDQLTSQLGDNSSRAVICAWFRYSNVFNWVKEVANAPIDFQFGLRRDHLLWKLKKTHEGERKEEYIERLKSAGVVDAGSINKRKNKIFGQTISPEKIDLLAEFGSTFDGLAFIYRFTAPRDTLTEIHGLDLTPKGNRLQALKAFEVVYSFVGMAREGDILSIQGHLDGLLERVIKKDKDAARDIVKEYDESRRGEMPLCLADGGCGEAKGKVGDIVDILSELGIVGEDEKRELIAACESVINKNFDSVEMVYKAASEEKLKFFSITIGILQKLRASNPTENEKKEIVKLREAESLFNRLLLYRGAVETARAYLKN